MAGIIAYTDWVNYQKWRNIHWRRLCLLRSYGQMRHIVQQMLHMVSLILTTRFERKYFSMLGRFKWSKFGPLLGPRFHLAPADDGSRTGPRPAAAQIRVPFGFRSVPRQSSKRQRRKRHLFQASCQREGRHQANQFLSKYRRYR